MNPSRSAPGRKTARAVTREVREPVVSDMVADAFQLQVEKHREYGETREGGAPYSVHGAGVLAILMHHGVKDRGVLCAGLLHDVPEGAKNRGAAFMQITKRYGARVSSIVREVTKKPDGTYDLKTKEGFIVKMADRLHNLHELPIRNTDKQRRYLKKTGELIHEQGASFQDAHPQLFKSLVAMYKERQKLLTA